MTPTERVEGFIKNWMRYIGGALGAVIMVDNPRKPLHEEFETQAREALSLTRREALLEAAKVCSDRAEMRDKYECDCRGYIRAAEHDAEEITALADKEVGR